MRARTKLAAKKWLKLKRAPPASETTVDTDMIREQESIWEAEMLRQEEEQRQIVSKEEKEIAIEGDAGVL